MPGEIGLIINKNMNVMARSKILWVDLQPSLYCLNKRVAQYLSRKRQVKRWSFQHDLDESCNEETVYDLLCETLQNDDNKYHIIGHGLSGTLACKFAQKYPQKLKSLTLLSVDTHTSNHWSSHYLKIRSQLPCSRTQVLSHLSSLLFHQSNARAAAAFPCLLAKCLDSEYIQGSVISQYTRDELIIPSIPVLIINGQHDFVVDENSRHRWVKKLKPGDCYQSINKGRHFFQFSHSQSTVQRINAFLDMVPDQVTTSDIYPAKFTTMPSSQS